MSDSDKPYVGGQAVIEGVMMRAPRSMAVAVRRADGSIIVRDKPWVSLWERLQFLRWPLFRGTVVLVESLLNGIQALNFAADQASVVPQTRPQPVADTAEDHEAPVDPEPFQKRSTFETVGTLALSISLAFGLFVGLPHLLAWGTGHITKTQWDVDNFGFHALDGLFKLCIFVGYIAGISLIPDIRRVFQYHGAEHKVVNAYEQNMPLTVENARSQTTFHARCGTSFVLFVLVLSIFIFASVFPFVPKVSEIKAVNHLAMILIKIPLMLPLSGIAYEINRYAARHPGQLWVQLLVQPGRLMQKLTTKEPDEDQLEIALAAMRAALRREASLKSVDVSEIATEPASQEQVLVFRNYHELAEAIPSGH